jgi:hypothetical protein
MRPPRVLVKSRNRPIQTSEASKGQLRGLTDLIIHINGERAVYVS